MGKEVPGPSPDIPSWKEPWYYADKNQWCYRIYPKRVVSPGSRKWSGKRVLWKENPFFPGTSAWNAGWRRMPGLFPHDRIHEALGFSVKNRNKNRLRGLTRRKSWIRPLFSIPGISSLSLKYTLTVPLRYFRTCCWSSESTPGCFPRRR